MPYTQRRILTYAVNQSTVTLGGAALFFIFGLFYLYTASQPSNVDLIEDHAGSA